MQELQTFKSKSGEEIILRPAEPGDEGGIITTLKSTALERSYVLMQEYGRDEGSLRTFLSQTDREKNLFLVALAGGTVVGSLAAHQKDEGRREQTAHVLEVGVHLLKDYRGQGVGFRMLRYALEWGAEQGFKKIVASIFTPNKRSLDLFRKAGFEEECLRRAQIRIGREYIDEVCMVRFLD